MCVITEKVATLLKVYTGEQQNLIFTDLCILTGFYIQSIKTLNLIVANEDTPRIRTNNLCWTHLYCSNRSIWVGNVRLD